MIDRELVAAFQDWQVNIIEDIDTDYTSLDHEEKKWHWCDGYNYAKKKLQKENLKLKEAMKAELKRCGGTVPILSECLEELK